MGATTASCPFSSSSDNLCHIESSTSISPFKTTLVSKTSFAFFHTPPKPYLSPFGWSYSKPNTLRKSYDHHHHLVAMLDLKLHHDHQEDQHLFSPNLQSSSSFSSISNPIFMMTPSHQSLAPNLGGSCDFSMESHQQEACNPIRVDESGKGLKFKVKMREDRTDEYGTENIDNSAKWMSSKMRMMRKMINTKIQGEKLRRTVDNHENDNSSNSSSCNNSSSVRVCTDCNTTKTPLWRSGPTGPKSLCNACGIRQRKARRAMAATVNGSTASNVPPPMKKVLKLKNKRSPSTQDNNGPQFKKTCKININNSPSIISGRKTISFEDLRMSLISNSGFEQVFPQDEKEAAILLMALSYGLVH